MILVGLMGCGTNYGQVKRSPEMTRFFETSRILEDHTYYYLGLDYIPIAIVALHNNYDLQAKFWREIDFDIIELDQLIKRMLNRNGHLAYGFRIVSLAGEPIGGWYSSLYWATIKFGDGKTITMLSPELPLDKGQR